MARQFSLSEVALPSIGHLSGLDLGRLSLCCRALAGTCAVEGIWDQLLARDLLERGGGGRARYGELTTSACRRCHRELWAPRRGGWRHCLCVARRRGGLPLTVVSLSRDRCDDGSFCEWEGHAAAREAIAQVFEVRFEAVDQLTDAALAEADLVVVHTTSAPLRLSPEEQGALARFCEGGGTGLLNCFSNWTRNGGHGAEAVAFLGVRPVPRAGFGARRRSTLRDDAGDASADLCLAGSGVPRLDVPRRERRRRLQAYGAYGLEHDLLHFENVGETLFHPQDLIDNGRAVRLCKGEGRESDVLLWFPAACGGGQALVCSNMHWIANADAWQGGFVQEPGNRHLLLNLCAAACRALG